MNSKYLFKVWISTILTAPLLFLLLTLISSEDSRLDSGACSFYIFSLLYGISFSAPTLVGSYILFFKLEKTVKSPLRLKTILLSLIFICMAVTIFILFGADSYNTKGNFGGLTFTSVYGISIIAFGILYKIK
jgi:hypothetical protein